MKGNKSLKALIRNFEKKIESGAVLYLEENETRQLIGYYQDSGLLEKAIEVVDMAISSNIFREENYLLKAKLLRKNGDYYEALDTLDEALLYSPNSTENAILYLKVLIDIKALSQAEELLKSKRKEISFYSYSEFLLIKARLHEVNKEFHKMYEVVKKALFHKPNSREILEKFWISVELTNKYEESIEIHKEIIDLNPYSFQAWYNLGHAYACIGEYHAAVDALEYSFIIKPDFEVGYMDCADICFQTENIDKALNIYKQALDNFGPEAELLLYVGECYFKMDKISDSIKYLYKSSKLDPYNDEAYYYLGMCYMQLAEYEDAISYFHKALKLEERREEYYLGIAQAYKATEEYLKSNYYFGKATETGPEDHSCWEQHAEFLYRLEEYKEALEVIEESEFNTYGERLECLRIACLFNLGKEREAFHNLENALSDNIKFLDMLVEFKPDLVNTKEVKELVSFVKRK